MPLDQRRKGKLEPVIMPPGEIREQLDVGQAGGRSCAQQHAQTLEAIPINLGCHEAFSRSATLVFVSIQ
jgi:hypothetical protein